MSQLPKERGPDGNNLKTPVFCWSALVAQVLHPAQVEIIEVLRWFDRPLSVADLLRILEGDRAEPRIEHHLRRLLRIKAVALVNSQAPHPPLEQRSYRLVKRAEP